MNVVDMTGRPITADGLARAKQKGAIDARLARALLEVDPTKLLGYLGSVLPVDDLAWQVRFVVDREAWLRDCINRLSAELDQ